MVTEEFKYHAPCAIRNDNLEQLISRLNTGFVPSIKISKVPSKETSKEIIRSLKERDVEGVSFDIGYFSEKSIDKYLEIVDFVANLKDILGDGISKNIGIKLGTSKNPLVTGTSHLSYIDIFTHDKDFKVQLDKIYKLFDHAARRGLNFSVENEPSPNYTNLADFVNLSYSVEGDPHVRFKNWSQNPAFKNSHFFYSKNIVPVLKESGVELSLDVEHLLQSIEWSHVFNLDRYGDRVQVSDLDEADKYILKTYGFDVNKDFLLWDYTDLTDREKEISEKLGYIIRPGQPMIFNRKLTLEDELNALKDSVISEITPGFQVYHAYFDNFNGEEGVLKIGSHLAGITSEYFENEAVMNKWIEDVRTVHALVYNFMLERDIRDIEIEPQIANDEKVVYDGPVWEQNMNITKSQLIENFKLAKKNQISFGNGPFYLK